MARLTPVFPRQHGQDHLLPPRSHQTGIVRRHLAKTATIANPRLPRDQPLGMSVRPLAPTTRRSRLCVFPPLLRAFAKSPRRLLRGTHQCRTIMARDRQRPRGRNLLRGCHVPLPHRQQVRRIPHRATHDHHPPGSRHHLFLQNRGLYRLTPRGVVSPRATVPLQRENHLSLPSRRIAQTTHGANLVVRTHRRSTKHSRHVVHRRTSQSRRQGVPSSPHSRSVPFSTRSASQSVVQKIT